MCDFKLYGFWNTLSHCGQGYVSVRFNGSRIDDDADDDRDKEDEGVTKLDFFCLLLRFNDGEIV